MKITEHDRQVARDAMVAGFNDCSLTNYFGLNARQKCDCDLGAIDGCKARVETFAKAIAAARSPQGRGPKSPPDRRFCIHGVADRKICEICKAEDAAHSPQENAENDRG